MRTRLIKPGFFRNEELAELPIRTRYLFAGLWCIADREGRLVDKPKRILTDVFPYDRTINDPEMDSMLQSLSDKNFILRYAAGGEKYIQIVNFHKHQHPHEREMASTVPGPCQGDAEAMPQHNLGDASAQPRSSLGDSSVGQHNVINELQEGDAKAMPRHNLGEVEPGSIRLLDTVSNTSAAPPTPPAKPQRDGERTPSPSPSPIPFMSSEGVEGTSFPPTPPMPPPGNGISLKHTARGGGFKRASTLLPEKLLEDISAAANASEFIAELELYRKHCAPHLPEADMELARQFSNYFHHDSKQFSDWLTLQARNLKERNYKPNGWGFFITAARDRESQMGQA